MKFLIESTQFNILENLGIKDYTIDYSIWRRDGTLDEFRFSEMLKDI